MFDFASVDMKGVLYDLSMTARRKSHEKCMIFSVTVGRKPTEKGCTIFSYDRREKTVMDINERKKRKEFQDTSSQKMPGAGSFLPKIRT